MLWSQLCLSVICAQCMFALVCSAIKYKCFCMVCIPLQNTLLQLSNTMWMQSKTCINFPWCSVSVIKGHWFELQPRSVLSYNSTFLVSFFFPKFVTKILWPLQERVKVCRDRMQCSHKTSFKTLNTWLLQSCKVVRYPKNPLCWRNILNAKGLKVGLIIWISWNQGKESLKIWLNCFHFLCDLIVFFLFIGT